MEKQTLSAALNEFSQGTTSDIDSIMIKDAAGKQYWMKKADLASVLGGLIGVMNGHSELAGLISSKRYNTRTCITLSKGPAWVKVLNFDNNGWNAALLDVYIHKRNGTSAMHSKSIIQFDAVGNVKLEGDSGVVGYVVNGGKISIYIKSLYTETAHVFLNIITDAENNNISIVEYPLTEPDGIIYL